MQGRARLLFLLAVILGLVVFAAAAYADNTVPDGDGVTPVEAHTLAFDSVTSNVASSDEALVAIKRNGGAGSQNVFKDGSTVTITVQSVSGSGLSAVINSTNSITLPSNWGALANNTVSAAITSTVTINSSTVGTGSGSVSYRATGINSAGEAIYRDASMTVTWNTLAPADGVAPVTTITPNPGSPNGNNGWYTSAVNVQVSASDVGGAVFETRSVLDPGVAPSTFDDLASGNPYGGSGSAVSSDGVHTIYAASIDTHGNKEPVKSWSFRIDKTAPTIVPGSADGLWHAVNVSIACSASDGGSGLAVSADASFSLNTSVAAGEETADASTDSRDVYDAAGNRATAGPIDGNMIDRKAPAIDAGAADGIWHAEDVSITCTASDSGSGLADPADASISLMTSVPAGTETANASTDSYDVADAVGNVATAGPISGNMIDKKAPTFSRGTDDGSWHADNVSLACTAADGGSGLSPASDASFNLSTSVATGDETANASTGTYLLTDAVGNQTTVPSIDGIKVDRKAPTFDLGSADGVWHADNVSIACTASDGGSGLKEPADASFTLATSVGAGTEMSNATTDTYVLTDAVGNSVTVGPIGGNMIDRKAPTIVPDAAPVFTLMQSPAEVSGTATDGGSGPASQRVSVAADTTSIGGKTVDLFASDNVGNVATYSAPYSVIYSWSGFLRPVDNVPFVNVAKAGSAIPVKFSLSGFQGYSIFQLGYPRSEKIDLATSTLLDEIEVTVNAGQSSLSYDSTTGQYTYVWKTDKTWAGTSRQLQVMLADGKTYVANFKLTK